MKREQKETIRRIMCILTAATLLAGCIPMKVTAVEEGNLPHYLDESNRLDQEISGEDGLQKDDSDQGDSTKDDSDGDDLKEDITDENEFEKNDSDTNDSGADGSAEDDSNKEPARPEPPRYVLGGDERIELTLIDRQYQSEQNSITYQAQYQIFLEGFYREEVNDNQELQVEIWVDGQDEAQTERYIFTEDGNVEQKFPFHVSSPGEYSITTVMHGCIWDEETEEWQEREIKQQFQVEVEKLFQELQDVREKLTLRYGDTLDVAEYVASHLQIENVLYTEHLEVMNDASDKLRLTDTQIRAIGIAKEDAPAVIRVRYGGSEWFTESQEVAIPVVIAQVTPDITLRLDEEREWQTSKTIPIHGELALHAQISQEEGAYYEDLLQKDDKLKLQYRIIHESSGAVKEYTLPFGWNKETGEKTYHAVLPIGWRYFTKLHKGEQYRLEMAVLYNGTDCPYEMLPKQSCQLTLQAANAYIKPEQSSVELEYRKAWNQDYQMPFILMHKGILKDTQVMDEEELSQIQYELRTSDPAVASVEKKPLQQEDIASGLPYTITGVGETSIGIKAVKSPTYDVESGAVQIQVKNSSIREEDYSIHYSGDGREQVYTLTQWQEYLKQHNSWLKAPVTISLTDAGAKYYDTLHCQEQSSGNVASKKEKILYTADQPVTEHVLWMTHKDRNASTKDAGVMPSFSMGIDQKKPQLIAVEDNGRRRYQETSTDDVWYMGEYYEIRAAYEDTMSGIALVEYTTDAGRTWHAFPLAKDNTNTKVQECRLTLKNGTYQGIGLRAVDAAGNISEEYHLANQHKQYIQLVVDNRIPKLDLQVTKNSKESPQQGVEDWTNLALHYKIQQRQDNPAIYKLYYQYVPIHQVQEAIQKGQKPYAEKQWQEMDEAGFGVGAYSQEEVAVNRNGTYYFKIISMCGLESEIASRQIRLQQTLPEAMEPIITNDQGEEWYHAGSLPASIAIDCKAYLQGCVQKEEYEAPITIHTRLISSSGQEDKTVTVGFETTEEYLAYCKDKTPYSHESYQKQLQALRIDFAQKPDDIYRFSYWIEDAAGNRSDVYEHAFYIDTTPPEQLQVWLEGKEFLTGELDRIIYDTFSQTALQGEVTAQDALSGIDHIQIIQAKKYGEWTDGARQVGSSFRIEPSTRCFLYVVAKDVAGNETAGWTNGIVVDDQTPSGQNYQQLITEPAGANDNGFYKEDITVHIAVQDKPDDDNYAALESVSCQITSGQVQEYKELYHTSKTGISEDELRQSASFSAEELIDAAKFEGNEASIEVTALDRAGNKTTSTQIMKIDVTAPEIEITFDQEEPVGDRFFTTDRMAAITVTEKNFDAGLVEWEVTRDGEPYHIPVSGWSSEGDRHQATMLFTEDGEYTLTVTCKDLADNEAEPVSAEPFCMDQTKPVIEIEYDGAQPHRDNYYREARTAVVTIQEHNFTPDTFHIETAQPYQMLGWSHEGDTHRLRICFQENAYYQWNCQYTDMAGNEAEQLEQQEFYIDSIAPVIEITGVINDSANAGEVQPVVTVLEEHFNAEETRISLVNGKGEQIEIPSQVHQVNGGYSYILYNVNEKPDQVYYLHVNSLDMAGNEAELTYRFSLNRNGSVYDMSLARQATAGTYYQSRVMKDLQMIEMNVDEVEQFAVYVSRNGVLIPTVMSDVYHPMTEDVVLYNMERQGNEQLGYVYTYTLFGENFAKEGTYQVALYSKDAAGNEVSSTLKDKDAGLHFIIDNTPPQIVMDGIEAGGIYDASQKKVNVMFSDNGMLTEARLSLHNDKGEEISSWDYMELAAAENHLMLEIAEYGGGQRFLYRAVDAAGNELLAESMESGSADFVITTNPWIRLVKSRKNIVTACGIAAAGVGVSGVAAGLYYRRRKRGRYA